MGVMGPRVGALFDKFGSRPLVIPGSIGIVVSLFALTQIGAHTAYGLILGDHALLMISLAGLFTPVFTLGLGDVPMALYSHGSSMLGTIQQVAGAFGTALVITLMTSRTSARLEDGATLTAATIDGMQLAFFVSGVIAMGIVVLATMLPSRPAADPHAAADLDAELERLDDGVEELSPGRPPAEGADQHHPQLGACRRHDLVRSSPATINASAVATMAVTIRLERIRRSSADHGSVPGSRSRSVASSRSNSSIWCRIAVRTAGGPAARSRTMNAKCCR